MNILIIGSLVCCGIALVAFLFNRRSRKNEEEARRIYEGEVKVGHGPQFARGGTGHGSQGGKGGIAVSLGPRKEPSNRNK